MASALQGLFRLIDKPFVGVDVLAAAVTMDKEFTKILAETAGVPVAKWVSIKRYEYDDPDNEKLSYDWVAKKLGTTNLFVKPSLLVQRERRGKPEESLYILKLCCS